MATNVNDEWEDVTPQNDSEWEDIPSPQVNQRQQPGLIKQTMMQSGMDLSPAGLLQTGYEGVQGLFKKAGPKVEQALVEGGIRPMFARESIPVSPGIAKAAGKFVEYGPDIVSTVASPIPSMKKPIEKTGRLFAGGVERMTGIPEEATANVFSKPSSLFTAPTQKTVSAAYAKSEIPINQLEQSLDEIIQKAKGTPRAMVTRGANELKKYVDEGVAQAKSILQGRQGLDREIDAVQSQINTAGGKNASSSALQGVLKEKLALRETFNRALDKLAPKLREADALATERFKVSPYRDLFLPGQVNFISPKGLMRMVPGLPTAMGLGTAAAGSAAKVPVAVASQIPKLTVPIASKLTQREAQEIFDQAGGDPEKAREIARQQGREWD